MAVIELLTFPCPSLLPLLEIGLFLIHCLYCYPRVSVRFLVPRHKAVEPLQKSPANPNIHGPQELLPFRFLLLWEPLLHALIQRKSEKL